jgi:hypothetical protein
MTDGASFEIPESAVPYKQIYFIHNFIERQIHEDRTAEMFQNDKDK